MQPFRIALATLLLLGGICGSILASVTVNLDAGRLRESSTTALNAADGGGALLLLIASGADHVFSNNNVAAGSFVSDDDVVLAAAGFNDHHGADFTGSVFMFAIPAGAQAGQPVAVRWFPRTTLSEYASGTAPAAGDPFGTYSPRMNAENTNDNPDGAQPWLLPADGATTDLRFFTSDSIAAGSQSPAAGHAGFAIQTSGAATPTPSPSPTASPTPSPTASLSPSASPSPSPTPSPTPVSHLANISTRLRVGTDDDVLIAGFILRGHGDKPVVVRGIGPSLSLAGRLSDPVLELFDSEGRSIAANDDWQADENGDEVQASTLAPSDPREPALYRRLAAADTTLYTAIVSGKAGATGVALVEVYDLDQNSPVQIMNIATRGFVQREDDVMIGGLIVTGTAQANVIVRAIGPSLGLSNALADPVLEVFDNNGARIAINDNWKDGEQEAIASFDLAPPNEKESALRVSLNAGNYTAIVSGAGGGTGVALVEVYKLSP